MRAAAFALVFLASGCPRVTPVGAVDAGVARTALSIRGSLCTTPAAEASFPLKVLFLLDQSGSMCITDPPGRQASGVFCQSAGVDPPGVTRPARTAMLQAALARLAAVPSARAGLITFEQQAKKAFPPATSAAAFGAPGDPALLALVDQAHLELGSVADLQGALALARSLIEADIAAARATEPSLLPRTRYQLVLITDGAPSPRCSQVDDALAYASAANPGLRWADTDAAFCNSVTPSDPGYIPGFTAGGDRNQNEQLFALLDALESTAAQARVGKLELHALLITNAETIAQCGAACGDLYPPDSSSSDRVEAARVASRWLFGELARRLEGTLREFQNNAGLGQLAQAEVDAATLLSPTVIKGLYVQPLTATRPGGAWEVDSDGDGLADAVELGLGPPTRADSADTDGDGFDDHYEHTQRSLGFDPLVKDTRGCDPALPATLGCAPKDQDGDGLSQYAEAWLSSLPLVVDSDGDGIPDGLEARAGLDPSAADLTDGDGDGVLDAAEVQRGTDPRAADSQVALADLLSVALTLSSQGARTSCYELSLDGLPLQAPQGQPAYFKIWLGQAPAAVPRDEGAWLTACARARRVGEVALPADLLLPGLDASFFRAPHGLPSPSATPDACLSPPGL